MPVLAIEATTVEARHVDAVVRVLDRALIRTSASAGLAERAVALLPGLRRHRCANGTARGIIAELGDTETPHLLEHVTIELAALSGSPRTLSGRTSWDFERDGRGVFRVRIEFDDDLVALAALRHGSTVVDWLFGRGAEPDMEAFVAELRRLRAVD